MENYTLNTESKNIVDGINEVDNIYEPVIENGDPALWSAENGGYETGTLTQEQYNSIKTRIEKGLPIVIRVVSSNQYITTYVAITTFPSTIPGRYEFCYTDFDSMENQFYIRMFRMESDLTCSINTRMISW